MAERRAHRSPGAAGRRRGSVSRGALIGGVIGALVLGVIAGGLIGWQVEKKRVEDDVASVKKRVQASAARNLRPVGVVTAVNGDSVTLRLKSAPGSRTFRLTGSTKIDRNTSSGSSKLVKGATVIVLPDYTSASPTASEIVVLPSSTSAVGEAPTPASNRPRAAARPVADAISGSRARRARRCCPTDPRAGSASRPVR